MFVQIFASSAWTGVVCTISVPKTWNSSAARLAGALADAADDGRQRVDLLEEVVDRDALGHVRDEDVSPDVEAAALLDVAGEPVGGARPDGRAQDQRVALAQQRHQIVDHAADVGDVDLDVRERRRVQRQHDLIRSAASCTSSSAEPAGRLHALEQLLRAGLLERHLPAVDLSRTAPRARRRSRRDRGQRRRGRAAGRPGRGRTTATLALGKVLPPQGEDEARVV